MSGRKKLGAHPNSENETELWNYNSGHGFASGNNRMVNLRG